MGFRLLTATALSLLAAAPCHSQDSEDVFERLLVLQRVSSGGRAPVFSDAIEAAIARGDWKSPNEGDVVTRGDRPAREWTALQSTDGTFRAPALAGGYAYAAIESATDRVAILDAAGHRHVYVNGAPRAGDVYSLNLVQVPVELKRGTNEFLFKGGRGSLRARLVPPPAEVFVAAHDATLPHLIEGENEPLWGGIIVTNATPSWQRTLSLVVHGQGTSSEPQQLPVMPPASIRKMPFALQPRTREGDSVEIEVAILRDGVELHRQPFKLDWRAPDQKHRRTFVSEIDGSVQYYGVTPPLPRDGDEAPAMFLSVHGASVEALHQASCYQHKKDGYVIAPTNRRPFGFDWEDWGRLDALEVLGHAEQRFGTDPARTYLTGHSMGGHGTWSLGAYFPDRFAALGPSAGWRDFWAYGGGGATEKDPTPVQALLDRGANASRTLLMSKNYLHHGIYVLHGDADETVSVEQARYMRSHLAGFHPNFAYYEEPGAGHWWGNRCMDWPPMFDFLRQNRIPAAGEARHVQFTTVQPGISAACHWVTIEGQNTPLAPSHVDAHIEPKTRRLVISTDNVRRAAFDLSAFEPLLFDKLAAGQPRSISIAIDAIELEDVAWPADGILHVASHGATRSLAEPLPETQKGPHRNGTFKDAFRHRMIFVVATQGTPEESAWALQKARYDAETFWYRGNGSIDIVLDRDFDPRAERHRNVILYGDATTNAAWDQVLEGCPIRVAPGQIAVGERTLEGDDLACLFVFPRRGSHIASVGVVAGTGPGARRLTHQLPYFVSGAAYPDWIVIGTDMLTDGSAGVRGAGYFGADWSIENGDAAWRN